jgi:hypothetical protein
MANPPSPSYVSVIKDSFDRSIELAGRQFPRGMAYSILGMSDYLRQFPGASDIKRQMESAADGLVALYRQNSSAEWQWFEDTVAYDNAILPYALFAAGLAGDNKEYLEVAEKTCEFLLSDIYDGSHFSFVGNSGWYKRGGTRAAFDQQPIEAAGAILMLRAAYDATKDSKFLTLQRKAFDWFLGKNDLRIPLYDFRTKGCSDGLGPGGVNMNQGAESTLSFLTGLLAVIESYAIVDKIAADAKAAESAKKPIDIKSVLAEASSKKVQTATEQTHKEQVEELA